MESKIAKDIKKDIDDLFEYNHKTDKILLKAMYSIVITNLYTLILILFIGAMFMINK